MATQTGSSPQTSPRVAGKTGVPNQQQRGLCFRGWMQHPAGSHSRIGSQTSLQNSNKSKHSFPTLAGSSPASTNIEFTKYITHNQGTRVHSTCPTYNPGGENCNQLDKDHFRSMGPGDCGRLQARISGLTRARQITCHQGEPGSGRQNIHRSERYGGERSNPPVARSFESRVLF